MVVVNEAFAQKFGLGRNAVGSWMSRKVGDAAELDIQIVGLVQNTKYSDVKDEIPPVYYAPYRQNENLGSMFFYARTALEPEAALRAVAGVIASLDPNLPVEELKTMSQQIRETLGIDRVITVLSAAFAGVAALLAAIGLYGVLAYSVSQRTREIGLRMALGADNARIRGLVLGQVGRMTLAGTVIGLAAAYGLGTVASSLLFELQGFDLTVFVTATALLVVVAYGAGLLPALRAARISPSTALHYE